MKLKKGYFKCAGCGFIIIIMAITGGVFVYDTIVDILDILNRKKIKKPRKNETNKSRIGI